MNAAQSIVDGLEEAAIRRYLEIRGTGRDAGDLVVTCGHCGTPQVVQPAEGMDRFALVCCRCGLRTAIKHHDR